MELILFLIMISVAFLIGQGCLCIIDRKGEKDWRENAVTGAIIMIGLAEPVHIYGAFMAHPLSECTKYYLLLVAACLVIAWLIFTLKGRKKKPAATANAQTTTKPDAGRKYSVVSNEKKGKISEIKDVKTAKVKDSVYWLYAVLAMLIIFQLCMTSAKNQTGRFFSDTDITPETVQSFLATDSVYQSNPLTGQAYESGMPSRLRILDLSTFYAMIIQGSKIGIESLLYVVMPLFVITLFYLAYYQLAKRLFNEETERALFLVFLAIVVMAGNYILPLDGAHLLYDSHTGQAFRNCVLVPYTISSAMDGNWKKVILCVACEACIVWTLYGCGVCLAIGLVILLIRLFLKKKEAVA